MNKIIGVKGFTLIELLVVIAIISILSTIAVPNFLEAQVRAKVARAEADMRSLATALESYSTDNTSYPPRHHPYADNINFMPEYNKKLEEMSKLTTPIAYISRIPEDVFLLPQTPYPGAVLDYMDSIQTPVFLGSSRCLNPGYSGNPEDKIRDYEKAKALFSDVRWLLLSVGPDKCVGVYPAGTPGDYPPQSKLYSYSFKKIYDPHNGSISSGNILRLSTTAEQETIARMMGNGRARWGDSIHDDTH